MKHKFLLLSYHGQDYNKIVCEEDLYDAVSYHWNDSIYGAILIEQGDEAPCEED